MTLLDDVLTALGLMVPAAVSRVALRYPLRTADQGRLAAGARIGSGAPAHPDRMVLSFTVTDPAAGAPAVMPLFPGRMSFVADPTAPGIVPDPEAAAFDWNGYPNWVTKGRIRVDLDQAAIERRLAALGAAFPLVPTRVWYWPVVLPQAMLTEASLTAFAPREPVERPARPAVKLSSPLWAQHALAAFLHGRHSLRLAHHPSDAALDTAELRSMPTVSLDNAGAGELTMALARPVTPDDGTEAEVAAVAAGLDPGHPDHPLNAPLPVRRVLMAAAPQFDATGALAAETVASWPAGPRWFTLRIGSPGRPATPPYALGALAGQQVDIRAAATVLQDRRLPLHGVVTIEQVAAPGPNPPPLGPDATVSFPGGPLALAESSATDPADAARLRIAYGPQVEDAWAALMPPQPAARDALVARCVAITHSDRTRTEVTRNLFEYADRIRPVGWIGDRKAGATFDELFHGSRAPWGDIRAAHFTRLFDAMDLIGFADPAAPVAPVRPFHSLLLWVMEGMRIQNKSNLFRGGFIAITDLELFGGAMLSDLVQFSAADMIGASNDQIRTSVRVGLFWVFFGLDDNNSKIGRIPPDNQPSLKGPIATTVANHNAAFKAADDAVRAAGIEGPTRAQLNAAIQVRNDPPGNWEFRLKPEFGAIVIAYQYAEYLRRVVELPAGAREYASFPYAAYNANPVTATDLFNTADARIAADPAAFRGRDHEDALMATRLPADVNTPKVRVPRGTAPTRSTHPKVQAAHVAALADAWGQHLPTVW